MGKPEWGEILRVIGILLLPAVVVFWLIIFPPSVRIDRNVEGPAAVEELVDLSEQRLTGLESRVAALEAKIRELE